MKQVMEGSAAIAHAVARCRPQVIAAYPITPQTHIVEGLATLVAAGDARAEFINVESEFSAASVVLGASATGVRAYTATSSQGVLLMTEVLYNIAGLRLPLVLTCANRAISAPISIWNDHQDAMAVRDAGWVQLWAEDNQDAADLHVQAYRLAEQLHLPVMVNVDGLVLTHAYEPVDIADQESVDRFLPPRRSEHVLDPEHPISMGMLAEPQIFMEARYAHHRAMLQALVAIPQIGGAFAQSFDRPGVSLVAPYRMDGAELAIVAMGSVLGTIKETVDQLREEGVPVGVVKLGTYRPFPAAALREVLAGVNRVVVLEKALSPGASAVGGILAGDVRSALYGLWPQPKVEGTIAGLGGRDITTAAIRDVLLDLWHQPSVPAWSPMTLMANPSRRYLGLHSTAETVEPVYPARTTEELPS